MPGNENSSGAGPIPLIFVYVIWNHLSPRFRINFSEFLHGHHNSRGASPPGVPKNRQNSKHNKKVFHKIYRFLYKKLFRTLKKVVKNSIVWMASFFRDIESGVQVMRRGRQGRAGPMAECWPWWTLAPAAPGSSDQGPCRSRGLFSGSGSSGRGDVTSVTLG